MKSIWIAAICLSFIFLLSCSNQNLTKLEEPKLNQGDIYIKHLAYSLTYNESREQANWVAYKLELSELTPNYTRNNSFVEDTLVTTNTANNNDYKGSGFDRGHLAPAGDMVWNEQAMKESFYYSNMSPQLPSFNRAIWKELEEKVREWAKEYGEVYIACGPIFMATDSSIGANQVAVPSYFFKTILVYNNSVKQSVGFIFPHEKCKKQLYEYAVSVDKVENITGCDFYYRLKNKEEKIIELSVDLNYWHK